jgi:anti-sigma regulatory factor (Ser/Thr protein kinase)
MKCLKVESENLSKIFEKTEALLCDFEESLKFKAMLICEEVVTNQIRHTDFEDKEPSIELCVDLKGSDSIVFVFKDNAKEFNPLAKDEPDITKSLEETELGGLGIFMVKKYSKNLNYEYKDGFNILKVEL